MEKDFKDRSREHFIRTSGEVTTDDLQLGCLQRIADATEKMAQPFTAMVENLEWHRKERARLLKENQTLRNQIAGHKAAYTKLKNSKHAEGQQESEAKL